ncbi:MAG: hypothetical protein KKH91_00055 [Elusimicrobia bacterium]|nr:hypothetical protein [Elusimicrobiota bacterium]
MQTTILENPVTGKFGGCTAGFVFGVGAGSADGAISGGTTGTGFSFLGSNVSKQIWQNADPSEFLKPHFGHFIWLELN